MHIGLGSVPLLVFLLRCATQPGSSDASEPAPVEPPGAYNLEQHSENGAEVVSYELDEPYPAKTFLLELNGELERLRWTPLRDSWFNPGSPSSHVSGWADFEDATVSPTARVDEWMAEWVNADGAILSYVLKYSSSLHGEPVRDTLWVRATVMSPDAASAFQSQAAALAAPVGELQMKGEQTRRLQEQKDASVLRRDATWHGRIVLRLLDVGAPVPEPDHVEPTLFDDDVPPLQLDVAHANVESDPTMGSALILLVLSERPAKQLHQFSSTYLERIAAVVVDDEVVATPFIASPLEDVMAIHGTFTVEQANEIFGRIMN